MSDFDAVVVGGGIAGLTTAYLLASGGLEVAVVERGSSCGTKNMTGGRIYSHSLEKIFPDFADEGPIERKITQEKISLMTADSAVTVGYRSGQLGQSGQGSYSVLRATFDPWLARQAEQVGASIISGIRVDGALVKDNKVCGIRAGGEEITADVTVLADGVNSLLAKGLGMRGDLSPDQLAVGAKEVIMLDPSVIEDRFQCSADEGTAWLFAGQPSAGKTGGGFIYTNKETISVGVVATLSELVGGRVPMPQLVEDFRRHPAVEPLIRGGELVEYSAHLVPEGGLAGVPELYRDGVVIVGDAAGFCLNIGYMVRGMDLAVGSADCAAATILAAKDAGDYSAASLSSYQSRLERCFVMQDMRHYCKFSHFLETTPRIFTGYPEMATGLMHKLFTVDGQPPVSLRKKLMRSAKEVGLTKLARDGIRGVNAL